MYQPNNGPWEPIDPASELPLLQGNEYQLQVENSDYIGGHIPSQLYLMQQAQGHILQQQMPPFWQPGAYLNPQWDASQMWNHNVQQAQGYMVHGPPYYPSVVHGQPLVQPAYATHDMHTQFPPMQHQHAVHRTNRPQHQRSAATTNQQNPPQAQALQDQPTFLQVELGKYLGERNLRRIFPDGKDFKIEGRYGYVKLPSKDKADAAVETYESVFEAAVGVGPTSVCPNSTPSKLVQGSTEPDEPSREGPKSVCPNNSPSELVPGSTKADESSREAKSWPETDRPSAHILMGWLPFLEFLSEKKNYLVESKKFTRASKIGTVSPSAERTCCTSYGNRLGTGFIHYMGQAHMAGKSWAGKFSRSDLVVSTTFLCMIDRFPDSTATYLNIEKDLLVLIEELFRLYVINGRMPAYFDDLLEKMKNPPKNTGSVVNYLKSLHDFFERLVNHPGFADEKALCILLQEIWVNCKKETESNSIHTEFPTGFTPTKLVVFVTIDRLLQAVYRQKDGLTTHADEGEYLRHFVHHVSDYTTDFFPAKERVALVGWYFEKFMPRFVDVMAENKNKRDWLCELWQLYKKEYFELGAMVYSEICSMSKEAVAVDRAGEDVLGVGLRNNLCGEDVVGNLGIGLRNKPGENNCFLNVTVQMLLHVKEFYGSLLKIDDVGNNSIVHELTHVFKALMEAPQEQGEAVTVSALRTALGTAYPKERFEEGREHEVSLAVKLILESIHLACAGESCEGGESCLCTAHDIFGLDGEEWTHCPCGLISNKMPHKCFSVSIGALALLKSMDGCQGASFSDHMQAVLTEDEFHCADEQCQKITHLSRTLLAPPSVYTIDKIVFRNARKFLWTKPFIEIDLLLVML